MINVVSICGSIRAGSYNAMVARSLPLLAPPEMQVSASPPIDEIPPYSADVQALSFPKSVIALGDSIRAADGVVIITPEYNYSVPGVLKNAIDWVSRLPEQPFFRKPVAIQSASQGILGGARAQYHLRQIMVFLEAHVLNKPEVFISAVQSKVEASHGELTDETARKTIGQQLQEFTQFVHHAKLGR